jgi:hypothetical protein
MLMRRGLYCVLIFKCLELLLQFTDKNSEAVVKFRDFNLLAIQCILQLLCALFFTLEELSVILLPI